MAMATVIDGRRNGNRNGDEYDAFLERMNARFLKNVNGGSEPLFTTNATGLWDAYLNSFVGEERQYHTCNACRHFVERFGGLVTIGDDGITAPAFWDAEDVPAEYVGAVERISAIVRKAKVTGIFISSDASWGTASNVSKAGDEWHHMHIIPPKSMVYRTTLLTAGQKMAERREDKKNVSRALSEFNSDIVDQAVQLLKTDSLYRSEKVLGPAEFLQKLYAARNAAKNRDNITWKAVALAPAGFCHPRSSMVGTLLEDLEAGKSFEDAAAAFKSKMHPLNYQRPQADPSIGAIEAAEKLVEKLGIAPSLERRFATVEEIDAIWREPAKSQDSGGGVFGHLKNSGKPKTLAATAGKITFEKFRRDVLPTAESIEVYAPSRGGYGAIVTAQNFDAPPIIQWDSEDRRNPFSWYVWHGGSYSSQWGISGGSWRRAPAIALYPAHWYGASFSHHQKSGIVIIEGARESKVCGSALFPEILRSELHGCRAVIEAHSRTGTIAGMATGSACGIVFGDGASVKLRVTVGKVATEYEIDRWE